MQPVRGSRSFPPPRRTRMRARRWGTRTRLPAGRLLLQQRCQGADWMRPITAAAAAACVPVVWTTCTRTAAHDVTTDLPVQPTRSQSTPCSALPPPPLIHLRSVLCAAVHIRWARCGRGLLRLSTPIATGGTSASDAAARPLGHLGGAAVNALIDIVRRSAVRLPAAGRSLCIRLRSCSCAQCAFQSSSTF